MDFQIPKQAMFFYRGNWNSEMDSMLLSTLITLRSGRQWEDANVPDEVLRSVRVVLNQPFGIDLSTDDISVRVKLLKARYKRFKKVVGTTGVRWNMQDRVVTTEERDPSAAANFYQDEPEFSLLASFFGPDDVKLEKMQEVITISDNTEIIVLSESDAPHALIRLVMRFMESVSEFA